LITWFVPKLFVLPRKLPSPAYDAVMTWLLWARELVLNVATPEPFKVQVPNTLAPSLKLTLPVGIPPPGAVTLKVLVNNTLAPGRAGLAEEVTALVVPAVLTVSVPVA
jgi:hypothetical protein